MNRLPRTASGPVSAFVFLFVALGAAGCGSASSPDGAKAEPSEPTATASSAICFDTSATTSCGGVRLWPNGIINYAWANDAETLASKAAIRAAMDAWTAATSGHITFVYAPYAFPNLVIDAKSPTGGGLTPIGQPSNSAIAYMQGDNAGHELGHAIGFYHHFMRNDRARYMGFLTQYSSYDNDPAHLGPEGSLCGNLIGTGTGDASNNLRCVPDAPADIAQMIGPFQYRSVMQYMSHEMLNLSSGADMMSTINGVSSGPDGSVLPEDGSAALEMYNQAYGWGVFRPLDRAAVTSGPRDYTLSPGGSVMFNHVQMSSAPAIESWGNGFVDVYVRGSDDVLYQKYRNANGVYSDWAPIDSGIQSNPSAVSWGYGRSDVAAVATTGDVVIKTYAGGWRPLLAIGKPPVGVSGGSAPSIASWGPGRLDVFVRGQDNQLYVSSCQSGTCLTAASFSGWSPVPGGTFRGNPAAIGRTTGGVNTLDVFVHGGSNDNLWLTEYKNGAWGGYSEITGGSLGWGTSPAVASSSGAVLDVYVVGTDQRVWRKYWNPGTSWSAYSPMGGTVPFGQSLAVVATGSGSGTQVHIAAPVRGTTAPTAPNEGIGIWLRSWPASAL